MFSFLSNQDKSVSIVDKHLIQSKNKNVEIPKSVFNKFTKASTKTTS